jgi:hypothetical protein
MRFQGNCIQIAALALGFCCLPGLATAAVISNAGVFATDDQVWQLQFTLSSISTVTIQSFGYGGGTNGAGTTIPSGGFATDLTLFHATGSQDFIIDDQVGGNAPASCGPRTIDGSTGLCLDAYLNLPSLAAGSYILTLTQQGNPANGPTLADGFAADGSGNFTGGPFIDPFGNQRNGNWAVDISAAGLVVNTTPEPGTVLLTLLVIPGMVAIARRRRRASDTAAR